MALSPDFPAFRLVKVFAPAESILNIRWAMVPHAHPQEDLAFIVFRSNSPTGPWDMLGATATGRYEYTDYKAPGAYLLRTFYYIIRVASISGKGFRDSEPVILEHDPDNIALELVRKKNLSLTVKNGVPLAVLPRKSWGAKCSRCWHQQRLTATDADCPECYGTGFPGGYMNPVYIPGIINPPKKVIVDANISYKPDTIYAEIANHPVLQPEDIIVDRRLNVRYKVNEVNEATRRGHVVAQIPTLTRLDQNAFVNTIVVPEPPEAAYGRSWEMVRTS